MLTRTALRLALELKTFIHPNGMPVKISKRSDDPAKPNGKVLRVTGMMGLVSASGAHFPDATYEVARVTINRALPKGAQLTQHPFVRYAVTRKLPGSKMGRGKGDIKHYEYRIRPHTPVFEISGHIHPQDAKFALRKGAECLPGQWMVRPTGWIMPSFRHLEVARIHEERRARKEAELRAVAAGLRDGTITPNSPAPPIAFPDSRHFQRTVALPTPEVSQGAAKAPL
jgi:ribosomal protein L16/L10AE